MNPYFFGDSQKPLYGVYYPPRFQSVRNSGVLLCSPIWQEYMRTHLVFRQFANMLSEAGFHVLKFDYSGAGDSAGNSRQGNVKQWQKDILIAMDELKGISGAEYISLIGLRFGASLAATVSGDGFNIKDLVLWDPIVDGNAYLDELRRIHREKLALFDLHLGTKHLESDKVFDELLGYPSPAEMQKSIAQINLLEGLNNKAKNTFLIVSKEKQEYVCLRNKLAEKGGFAEYRFIPEDGEWGNIEKLESVLLVNEIPKTITTLIGQHRI